MFRQHDLVIPGIFSGQLLVQALNDTLQLLLLMDQRVVVSLQPGRLHVTQTHVQRHVAGKKPCKECSQCCTLS